MSSSPSYRTIPFLNRPPIIPGQFKVRTTPLNTSQYRQVVRECLHKFTSDPAPNYDREYWVGVIAAFVALLEPFQLIIMRRWQGQSLESALSHSHFLLYRRQRTVLRSRNVLH
jgi:hypothetical protein